jgi:alkanesulfonate monooxygenase SsuD/methylene tetrahydromethanopterin reductase-like flavin-dependent oxidoreductase (luciferase family)
VLDVHGWREIGEACAQAFRKGDLAGMSEAVPDELVDAIAIAGRPEEVRDRLREWEGLTEHPLLYPPTAGARPERVRENLAAIADTFGS